MRLWLIQNNCLSSLQKSRSCIQRQILMEVDKVFFKNLKKVKNRDLDFSKNLDPVSEFIGYILEYK